MIPALTQQGTVNEVGLVCLVKIGSDNQFWSRLCSSIKVSFAIVIDDSSSEDFITFWCFQVDILEETTRYILSLEQKLLEKVREHGLPEKLVKMKDNLAVSDDLSDSDNTTDNIDMNTLQSILHKYAQPEVERRLEEQKMEEEKRLEE